jgi:hypothetical protein
MKRAWLFAIAALALLAGPYPAHSFQFDGWRSGAKAEKILDVAKDKGVTLSMEGAGLFGKKEPEELAERVEYKASTKLMGYPAKLLFSFAPESKVLHTLRVEINLPMSSEKADMEVLADTIAKQLDAKYKDLGDVSAEGILGHLTDKVRDVKRRAWKGAGDLVTLEAWSKLVGNEVVVTYVDEKLAEKAKIEDRRIREKRLERSSGGDKGKF